MRNALFPSAAALAVLLCLGLGRAHGSEPATASGPATPSRTAEEKADAKMTKKKGVKDADASAGPSEDKGLWSKLGLHLTPYGHLRLDASRDSNDTNGGNTAQWSSKPGAGEELNLTCRHTRLGLDLRMPDLGGVTATGKVEIDFYGKGSSEVMQSLRLRHAFLKIDMGAGFYLLAGQTADVHGSLFLRTLNTAVGWNAGNLCFRRPQVRLGAEWKLTGGWFRLEAAAARALGKVTGGDLDGNGRDDGAEAAQPDLQAAAALAFPAWVEKKPIILSVGGHYGVERFEGVAYARTWSVVANVTLPLAPAVRLEGEIWAGSNLDAYRGGIGQGYAIAREEAVFSRGGFVQVLAGPFGGFALAAGFGADDPQNDTLVAGNRSLNRTFFGQVKWILAKGLWIGAEYQGFRTDYLRRDRGDDHRLQATFYLKF